jgi:hypothetical protein
MLVTHKICSIYVWKSFYSTLCPLFANALIANAQRQAQAAMHHRLEK